MEKRTIVIFSMSSLIIVVQLIMTIILLLEMESLRNEIEQVGGAFTLLEHDIHKFLKMEP